MDDYYVTATEKALHSLETLRETNRKRIEELREYEGIRLCSSSKKNRYFYARTPGSAERRYLGPDTSKDVCGIRELRYCRQLDKDIEREIRIIDSFLAKHVPLDEISVNSRLSPIYRSSGSTSEDPGRAWKEEKEKIKARHEILHPENLKMRAIDGTLMRSKSEVIIGNLLCANNIPYVYELPYVANGRLLYTDFTTLSTKDYKTEKRIEHQGMMSSSSYQSKYLYTLNAYLEAGLIPNIDIFYTFDDLRGGFDPSPIQNIIDTFLK